MGAVFLYQGLFGWRHGPFAPLIEDLPGAQYLILWHGSEKFLVLKEEAPELAPRLSRLMKKARPATRGESHTVTLNPLEVQPYGFRAEGRGKARLERAEVYPEDLVPAADRRVFKVPGLEAALVEATRRGVAIHLDMSNVQAVEKEDKEDPPEVCPTFPPGHGQGTGQQHQ